VRNKLVTPWQIACADLTQDSTSVHTNIQFGKRLMLRKDLIELLRNNSMDLVEIARRLEISQKNVEDDLRHLIKSLKHADYRLVVTPAYYRKCDFAFIQRQIAQARQVSPMSQYMDTGTSVRYRTENLIQNVK